MKKKEYLDLLEEVLRQNDVQENEMQVILEDYEELYDGYLEREMSDASIKEKLGSPYDVVASLKGSMKYRKSADKPHEKFIAVSPFIALIVFFVFGFVYDVWHPTWLVFFIIPLSAILFSVKEGFWTTLTAISPFVTTTFFILYGYYTGVYHPTWMVFLVILLCGFMVMKETRKYLYIGLLLLGSLVYLWIGLTYQVYSVTLLAYLPLLVALVYFGDLEIRFDLSLSKPIGYVVIFTLFVYFLGGYFFDLWDVLWLIFFLVPMVAIYVSESGKTRYVALTPFVSVTIFYLIGYYFDAWEFSWMAFLLIPMVAILLGDVTVEKKDD